MLQTRERRAKHGDEINRRRREKGWKKPNQQAKIAINLRKRVNRLIINRKSKNYYNKLLGCDVDFLKKWFEYNFKLDEHKNLTWDNYGEKWHMDHVKPCSSFDLENEKQQIICFHWSNIAPLLKEENLSKGNTYKISHLIRQEIRIKQFLKTIDKKEKFSVLN